MIVVDSSVWIDYLNDVDTRQTLDLDDLIDREPLIVGDLILCEVLQGLRTEAEARAVEQMLRRFNVVSLLDDALAVQAAANYRALRQRGITVRKTIDLIIGTFCIENDHVLLHADRDFEPLRKHLGLRTI
ncbi:MAG: PIN domain nuclease [Rhodospirillaceae bacterium]|nr:PIN domain nuclease [Rhodospirillaceae bacterium]